MSKKNQLTADYYRLDESSRILHAFTHLIRYNAKIIIQMDTMEIRRAVSAHISAASQCLQDNAESSNMVHFAICLSQYLHRRLADEPVINPLLLQVLLLLSDISEIYLDSRLTSIQFKDESLMQSLAIIRKLAHQELALQAFWELETFSTLTQTMLTGLPGIVKRSPHCCSSWHSQTCQGLKTAFACSDLQCIF